MGRRNFFTAIAVVLGLACLALGAVFIARMPRTLALAAGPAGLETHRYAEALARASLETRDSIRYRIVVTSGAEESARLLEQDKVSLAIIRSDFELPENGQTLLVNARRMVVVMASQARRNVQKFADLKGKRVAVVRLTDPNLPLVRKLLAVADIAEADVTLTEVDFAELPELLGTGKVDAAIVIAVPSSPATAEAISRIVKRLPGGLRFIPLAEAEAMASRIIGAETAELPAGSFGAGRPQEEIDTVAVTYRTMARATMPNEVAGQVAQSLYDLRTRMSRQFPVAFTAEPPDAKTGARIPVHPGATAYFDGEATTFIERYGELTLTVLWGCTLLGSAVSGLLAWFHRKRHDEGGQLLEEIAALTTQVRKSAGGVSREIEVRIDQIVTELSRLRVRGLVTENVMESATLALDHFRSVAEAARGRDA